MNLSEIVLQIKVDYQEKIIIFQNIIISLFQSKGRKLLWRQTSNPYHIVVSEIMLQQTNVDIVTPIYQEFLARFPTWKTLAEAPEEEVKKITDKLGYKRRGEYLQQIAHFVLVNGLPETVEGLLTLPGIGRYTAGAIVNFAFRKPAPIVDVNVERVLSRVFGFEIVHNAEGEKQMWAFAEAVVPVTNPYDFNQGIMDLGAIICIKIPKCSICPMQKTCTWYTTHPQIRPLTTFFAK